MYNLLTSPSKVHNCTYTLPSSYRDNRVINTNRKRSGRESWMYMQQGHYGIFSSDQDIYFMNPMVIAQ